MYKCLYSVSCVLVFILYLVFLVFILYLVCSFLYSVFCVLVFILYLVFLVFILYLVCSFLYSVICVLVFILYLVFLVFILYFVFLSLFCILFSCLYSVSCFLVFILYLVFLSLFCILCPMLLVSLLCQFLTAPSDFFYVCLNFHFIIKTSCLYYFFLWEVDSHEVSFNCFLAKESLTMKFIYKHSIHTD